MLQNSLKSRPFPVLAITVLLGLLVAGCGGNEPAGRSPIAAAVTPGLLPTPTLALPVNVDPLRPPTPIVYPSPTPPGMVAEAPAETSGTQADPASPTAVPPTPTAVPLPEGATPRELLELGQRSAAEGNQALAAAAFRAALEGNGDLDDGELAEAHLGLAVALMAEGRDADAERELAALADSPQSRAAIAKGDISLSPVNVGDIATFHLGQVRLRSGDYAGAVEAFTAYLQNNPDMAAYVQPLVADAHEALGATDSLIAALESATSAPAQRFKAVANRLRLASLYLARQDYPAAIAQYDAVREIARTEATKGQMSYLAGQAELMAGNTEAGHERLLFGVMEYPRATESYQGLILLLDAAVPVDEYQRGVVDYYAGAYTPAIEAFGRYISAAGDDFKADAHLFTAWSHESLGDIEAALASVEKFAKFDPARALFERGEMMQRAGQLAEALAAYDAFLTDHADADNAATVAWAAAFLADRENLDGAADRYLFLADTFPFHDNTPLALFRAAELLEEDEPDKALALRERLIEQYPANIYGAEALFRLLQAAKNGEIEGLESQALAEQVDTLSPSNYFALRAADWVAGSEPFSATGEMVLPSDPDNGRAEAEAWLRERLTADGKSLPDGDLGELSGELAADPQRIIGEKLWQLGQLEEAKAELEAVREAYAGDVLANYQLARFFSRLGLYRSSIIAAATLLNQTGATVFDAPVYLGRLAFPVYYADLILPLAAQYGFDPRLQFALVRQESLFESFARSGAAAQGLSQVIPDTGAWIAQRLAWPGFVNEDLYKPYVGLNFGAYYLSQQLRYFEGNVPAALAAYNAGPGNAAHWVEIAGRAHDLFVETVDFPETRLYIERIYEGFNAYRHLYRSP